MSRERLAWRAGTLLLGALALWFSFRINNAPYVTNDGYQYLDGAVNAASGECLCTRVALFDEQVAYGRFPIPFTHFAPGYPLLIAAATRMGMKPEIAGYVLSAAAFLAVIWMMQDLAVALGADEWVAALFSLIWITHATALFFASAVETESLFTACFLGLIILLVYDIRGGKDKPRLDLAIGFIAAASYGIRYPGLFLVAGAGIYLLVKLMQFPRARSGAIPSLLLLGVLTGVIQIRNAIYAGSWRGGFISGGGHSPREVAVNSIRAFSHLVTGDRVPLHTNIRIVFMLVAILLTVTLGIRAWLRPGRPGRDALKPLPWVAFIAFVYIGGVLFAALTTIASDLPRYFFPLYSLLLACAAVFCSRFAYGVQVLAVIALVASIIAVEGRNLFVPPATPDWAYSKALLTEEVRPGTSLLAWLQRQTSPDHSIAAVEGQAVHYVLSRPVVAIIPSEFSRQRNDEASIRSLMRQFRSQYLVLFPGASQDRIPEQTSSAFLQSVANGNPPSWLQEIARTRDAAVYECADCVR